MRYASVPLTIILCLTLLGCRSERKNKIEGTWRLVSGTLKTADTTTYDFSKLHYHGILMIYENHFAFVGRYVREGDSLDAYGGGTYTLDGNNYKESMDYHKNKQWIGETIPLVVSVKNDTLIQKGPRKIGKYQNSRFELYEVYERMN
jgi:hypothetical protein